MENNNELTVQNTSLDVRFNNMATKFLDANNSITNIIQEGNITVDKISNTILQCKEINRDIEIITANKELLLKKMDVQIDKIKEAKAALVMQTSTLSNSINMMLMFVLSTDPYSSDENMIKYRTQLIGQINETTDKLNTLLLNFLMM